MNLEVKMPSGTGVTKSVYKKTNANETCFFKNFGSKTRIYLN